LQAVNGIRGRDARATTGTKEEQKP
jgi:hypothetical protein